MTILPAHWKELLRPFPFESQVYLFLVLRGVKPAADVDIDSHLAEQFEALERLSWFSGILHLILRNPGSNNGSGHCKTAWENVWIKKGQPVLSWGPEGPLS